MVGTLSKCSKYLKNWSPRWFALWADGRMKYFDQHPRHGGQLRGTFRLQWVAAGLDGGTSRHSFTAHMDNDEKVSLRCLVYRVRSGHSHPSNVSGVSPGTFS